MLFACLNIVCLAEINNFCGYFSCKDARACLEAIIWAIFTKFYLTLVVLHSRRSKSQSLLL